MKCIFLKLRLVLLTGTCNGEWHNSDRQSGKSLQLSLGSSLSYPDSFSLIPQYRDSGNWPYVRTFADERQGPDDAVFRSGRPFFRHQDSVFSPPTSFSSPCHKINRIKVEEQPKSQKQKEGSRVEFKFKVEGNNSLLYQWFRDGVELPGQNNANLILDCIELRDFGCYTCRVRYQDGDGEPVVSSRAMLDVIPQCLNGMRPKLLHEVDLNTRDEIGLQLESRRGCLGGWRQVAAKFDMQDNRIAALDNSKEPGKDVLEFLMGTKPNLTVYSFCKVLKEDILSRFDIAKLLEDHLLIRKDSSS